MTTYNGSKYIIDQLNSINNQTVMPKEVIIVDDASMDDTISIVSHYIEKNALFNWKLIVNKNNIGWKKNFKKAFDLCTGQYIFPCDQDDIWNSDKLELMYEIMINNSNIELLASNYFVMLDGQQTAGSYSKLDNEENTSAVVKVKLEGPWPYILRPGCTYCFQTQFYNTIKKYWNTDYAHDAILWRYSAVRESLYIFEKQTMNFRRHGDNATSKRDFSRKGRIDDLMYYCNVLSELKDYSVKEGYDNALLPLQSAFIFFSERLEMIKKRNIFLLFNILSKNRKMYVSKKAILADILSVFLFK